MRLTYAKFIGYAGFYTGLGKSELEINFSKCRNNIVVISGANGCGKSTLLNALSILPDGNECFIPSMVASKQLQIVDQDIVYDVLITHGLDNHGNRSTTKAYIAKNGVELNPNGNVSSYKDIIFSEFSLDSNFITLTHVSGDDRGLADKRPAERKKFIASITASLDVYNDINKTLSKKANVLKSQIGTLSDKIRNIGTETDLRSSQLSLNTRYERITKEIEELKQQIIECRTVLALNDPDGTLQKRYNDVEEELRVLSDKANRAFSFVEEFRRKNDLQLSDLSIPNIDAKLEHYKSQAQAHIDSIKDFNAKIMILNDRIQNSSYDLTRIDGQIEKLHAEINPKLEDEIKSTKNQMFEIEDAFKRLGSLEVLEDISSGELKQLINVLTEIIKGIDTLYEIIDDADLKQFIDSVQDGVPLSIKMANISSKNADNTAEIYQQDKLISSVLTPAKEAFEELNNRPKNCKVDGCHFLQKFRDITKEYASLQEVNELILEAANRITFLSSDVYKNEELVAKYQKWLSGESIIDRLRTLINSNNAIQILMKR